MDDSYKQFLENEKQMVFKDKKRCSSSLIIGEMGKLHSNTISHLSEYIQNFDTKRHRWGWGGNRKSHPLLVGIRNNIRRVWQCLAKSHMHLSFDAAIPFLGNYPSDTSANKQAKHRRTYSFTHTYSVTHGNVTCNGKTLETDQIAISREMVE